MPPRYIKIHHLQKLVKNEPQWLWTEEQSATLQEIKTDLKKPPTPKYYNVTEEQTLSVDANSRAMGAVLMQD